jgi:site-specific DNA recombinase
MPARSVAFPRGEMEAAAIETTARHLPPAGDHRRRAARAEQDDITEGEVREALLQLDPVWEELFPAEQARIVQLLLERIDVRIYGVEVRLRSSGLAGLVRAVACGRRAAA